MVSDQGKMTKSLSDGALVGKQKVAPESGSWNSRVSPSGMHFQDGRSLQLSILVVNMGLMLELGMSKECQRVPARRIDF